ncbi:hypothetical protein BDV23DRAFT_146389 [Aspergillus alliaceus]|uniref:Uncharacterized protein n=1 Tax=Petromyces alliaceus TaxID=209559 RepID=A0A5N7CKN4_PETAA|nr:hypothetical protein BDV23DRAFT_146389 [Aspergillus alliaceus]
MHNHATAVDVQSTTVLVSNIKAISFDYFVISSGSTTASTNGDSGTPIPRAEGHFCYRS